MSEVENGVVWARASIASEFVLMYKNLSLARRAGFLRSMAGYTLSSTASVPPANVRLPFGVPTTPLGFDTVPVKSPTTPVSIATVPPGLTVFVGALRNEYGGVLIVWTAV